MVTSHARVKKRTSGQFCQSVGAGLGTFRGDFWGAARGGPKFEHIYNSENSILFLWSVIFKMRDMQLPIEIRPAITVAIRRLRETVRAHLRAATCLTAIDLAGLVYGRAPARRCVWNSPRVSPAQHSSIRRTLTLMKCEGEKVLAHHCKPPLAAPTAGRLNSNQR